MTSSPHPHAQPPLVKSVLVPWAPERAFTRFTAEMASWWPLRTHSVTGGRSVRCGIEPRVGGVVFEEAADGTRHVWGTVTAWEPPGRVAFTWHPARTPDTAQQVEVTFAPEGGGTRLVLTHTGWETLGRDAKKARRAYPLGWTYVLNCYLERSGALTNRVVDALTSVILGVQRLRGKG